MTVSEFIEKKNLSLSEFAQMIGVSVGIVRLWECRGVSPKLVHAIRINRITRGKVKMVDMLTIKDQREFACDRN